jgi:hypothetical protein
MQERDVDLANAYDEIDAQDKEILKMRIVIIVLIGIIVLFLFIILKSFPI